MKTILRIFIITVVLVPLLGNTQCYQPGELRHGTWLHSTSGNTNIDEVVFNEIKSLETFFKFNVDFFFGEEMSLDGSTAFFSPSCQHTPYCIGTIVLGFNMMSEKYIQYGNDYIHIVRSILAHEFGHGVQKLKGWHISTKYKELHADFLAGYYISKTYDYDDKMIDNFLKEFYSIGGVSIYHSHGTKEERYCAFLEGYYYAKESNVSVESADAYATQYVAANNPCTVRKYKAKVAQLEADILKKNVGSVKFKTSTKKKYVIITENQVGTPIMVYLNQSWIPDAYNRLERAPKINEYTLTPVSASTELRVIVYKKIFRILPFNSDNALHVGTFTLKVPKGKTATFEINGRKWTYTIN